MKKVIRTSIVGMDTSHAVEFPKFIQDPAIPAADRVHVQGMTVTRALRFETPFQNQAGLDQRQKYLEGIGVRVTENFDEAVADCDAVFIEINDPSLHLEYFRKCAELGKPIFLDKPFASTLKETEAILRIAKEKNVRFFTASSLRYGDDIEQVCREMPMVEQAVAWGPLGKAAAGSSIVWYGVHTFEMLERIMGMGAVSVTAIPDKNGVVCTVSYADGRRGVVMLTEENYSYGGLLRHGKEQKMFAFTSSTKLYLDLIGRIGEFFSGKEVGVPLPESFEIMAMLEAAKLSLQYGRSMPVYKILEGNINP